VAIPEPMLSAAVRVWPAGGSWILQPKWDGFRCLVAVDRDGRVRTWSRQATSFNRHLDQLIAACEALPPGTVLDGELVALAQHDGRVEQDFAAVRNAVLTGEANACAQLRFVAFDLLELAAEDLRPAAWSERDRRLRELVPDVRLIRVIDTLPATEAAHQELLALGFEGSVLKRPTSTYRPGRQSS
jgi:bifunctional non-homologous end joining protein LigD